MQFSTALFLPCFFIPVLSASTEQVFTAAVDINGLDSESCTPNPCKNGGICTANFFGYSCICKNGYSGRNCNENDENNEKKSFCSDHPCQNGGICKEILDFEGDSFAYECTCTGDYYGTDCDNKWETTNPLPIVLPIFGILFILTLSVGCYYSHRRRRVIAHIILTEEPNVHSPPPRTSNVYTMPPPIDPPPAYQPQTYGVYDNPQYPNQPVPPYLNQPLPPYPNKVV